jgi:hypothetical protein
MPVADGWRRREPIKLPRGRKLVTLRDAGNYITKLPKAEHEAPEWQAAMKALILVAENNGPTMFARIGVMRALNCHVERVFNSDRKDQHWGRRKLARDGRRRPATMPAFARTADSRQTSRHIRYVANGHVAGCQQFAACVLIERPGRHHQN